MNLISILLTILNQVKIMHWETNSYAQHNAFNFCYNELNDLIDEFVETYQGSYIRIKEKDGYNIELKNDLSYIETIQKFLDLIQSDFSNQIDPKDTDLLNLRDEIMGVLRKTLYLLSLK